MKKSHEKIKRSQRDSAGTENDKNRNKLRRPKSSNDENSTSSGDPDESNLKNPINLRKAMGENSNYNTVKSTELYSPKLFTSSIGLASPFTPSTSPKSELRNISDYTCNIDQTDTPALTKYNRLKDPREPRKFADIKDHTSPRPEILLSQELVHTEALPPELLSLHDNVPNVSIIKKLRYLVDLELNIIFGHEGYPDDEIPRHVELSNHEEHACLAVGNVWYDNDNQFLGIDHKSGDYRPKFESLKYALKAMLKHDLLPEKWPFFIYQLNEHGAFQQCYRTSKEALLKMPFMLDEGKVSTFKKT